MWCQKYTGQVLNYEEKKKKNRPPVAPALDIFKLSWRISTVNVDFKANIYTYNHTSLPHGILSYKERLEMCPKTKNLGILFNLILVCLCHILLLQLWYSKEVFNVKVLVESWWTETG